jgi:hypothetical protein
MKTLYCTIEKARTFQYLSSRDRKLAVFAITVLLLARVGLWLLPFKLFLRFVGRQRKQFSVEQRPTAQQIAWAVRLAARNVGWSACLQQAASVYYLLSWYGYSSSFRIGVSSEPTFQAHAWVECEGRVLAGGWEPVGRFATLLVAESVALAD